MTPLATVRGFHELEVRMLTKVGRGLDVALRRMNSSPKTLLDPVEDGDQRSLELLLQAEANIKQG